MSPIYVQQLMAVKESGRFPIENRIDVQDGRPHYGCEAAGPVMEDAAAERDGRMGMKGTAIWLVCAAGLLGLPGCTVISRGMMAQADRDVTFSQLKADTGRYKGQTVILGGHIIEVRNRVRETVMLVLESPLGSGQEPRPRDQSQGRFMLYCEGFLDPEVYAKGRMITVAARVLGQTREAIGDEPYIYPTLETREIYLWERQDDRYRYPPPYRPLYYDPWVYRYRRYGYPYP